MTLVQYVGSKNRVTVTLPIGAGRFDKGVRTVSFNSGEIKELDDSDARAILDANTEIVSMATLSEGEYKLLEDGHPSVQRVGPNKVRLMKRYICCDLLKKDDALVRDAESMEDSQESQPKRRGRPPKVV